MLIAELLEHLDATHQWDGTVKIIINVNQINFSFGFFSSLGKYKSILPVPQVQYGSYSDFEMICFKQVNTRVCVHDSMMLMFTFFFFIWYLFRCWSKSRLTWTASWFLVGLCNI